MKCIITVDVEADNQWKKGSEITLENLNALPRFQALCEKYGFMPTYLVTHEVAESEDAVVMSEWQKKGRAEVGAHLHPWTNPPFIDEKKEREGRSFLHEFSEDIIREKLRILTLLIAEKFGKRPTSFRAGKWAFNEVVARCLVDEGYIADCSVTPRVKWNENLDFRNAPIIPYYIDNLLLEVPMTIVCTQPFVRDSVTMMRKIDKIPYVSIRKIFNKLLCDIMWCRVFPETTPRDLKRVYLSAKKNNLPVIEFMIHSSELIPGGSIYSKSEKAVEKIYANIEHFFMLLQNEGVHGVTLSEFALEYKAAV